MSRRVSSLLPKRLQNKRLKLRLYKYGLWVGLFLLVILGTSFIARAHFARVQDVAISGNEIVKKDAIQQIVDNDLKTSLVWLFPRDNRLLFPSKDVENKILNQFPAVANVSVAFSGLNKLSVNVLEHKPTYLWCDSLSHEHCYFMDEHGLVFTESAAFSQGVLFTYYGLLDSAHPIGQTFLPQNSFVALNRFIDSMKILKLTPVGLNARSADDFQVYLSSGGSIFFSNREDFLMTYENIETIIAAQTRLTPDFLSQLDYIDVRFASKAFVKRK